MKKIRPGERVRGDQKHVTSNLVHIHGGSGRVVHHIYYNILISLPPPDLCWTVLFSSRHDGSALCALPAWILATLILVSTCDRTLNYSNDQFRANQLATEWLSRLRLALRLAKR